jgi:Antitoxin-like ribbon-helix-helix
MAKSKTQNRTAKRQIANLEPEVGRQLRQIADEKGITAQALMSEALDYLSTKYGIAQPMKRFTIEVRELIECEFSRERNLAVVSGGTHEVAPIESSRQETTHHAPIVGSGDFR